MFEYTGGLGKGLGLNRTQRLIFETSAFALSWVCFDSLVVVVVLTTLGCDAERRVLFVSVVVF